MLGRRVPSIKILAGQTLGNLRLRPETVVPGLTALLGHKNLDVVAGAVESLSRFGPLAAPAVPQLLTELEAAMNECNGLTECLIRSLLAITADAPGQIRSYFAERDQDLRRQVRAVLRAQMD